MECDNRLWNMFQLSSKKKTIFFYKVGEKRGIEKGSAETSEKEKTLFVKNLLAQTDHPITKIASLVGVTEAFVLKIKNGLS